MRIIYEALKKILQDRKADSESSNNEIMTRDDWIDVSIALVIGGLLATLIIVHYPQFKTPNIITSSTSTAMFSKNSMLEVRSTLSIPALNLSEYKNQHMLNGIFVFDNEKIAMINNRFFTLGEVVDGLKIVNIEFDRIKLKSEQGSLELRVAI